MRSLTSLTPMVLAIVLASVPGITSAADPVSPKFLLEWGKKGDAPGEFYSPIGLAFNSKDELFVTDLNNARVQKFSTDGKHLGGFDLPRDKPERKSTIIGGIAIDDADLIYLTYMNQNRVVVYRDSGEVVREWGTKGAGDGEFSQPGGILFPRKGILLICDQCNHRVQKFTSDGKYLGQWGGYRAEAGQFDGLGAKGSRFGGPHFLAQDSQGRLYTTEGIQGRVQQFTADGMFLAKWGDKGDEPGGFGAYQFSNFPQSFGPIGIAIDSQDRVLVSSLNDRVQFFETSGKYLFGITGTGLEGGDLLHPHGMAFDRNGHLYICDAGNQRIVKFKIP
ncbi:MAG: NHL repeat-containing protein [Planctomycetes bacterium]|nr:NHL repeat-containing protein [Planctomycetota bacterium]